MSARKKAEKAERRRLRVIRREMANTGTMARWDAAQKAVLAHEAEIEVAARALDWSDADAALAQVPKLARAILENRGVVFADAAGIVDVELVVSRNGGRISIGARPSVASAEAAMARLRARAEACAAL